MSNLEPNLVDSDEYQQLFALLDPLSVKSTYAEAPARRELLRRAQGYLVAATELRDRVLHACDEDRRRYTSTDWANIAESLGMTPQGASQLAKRNAKKYS